MADLKYLDGAGVQYLWNQIRASFATMSDLPTKVSQLTNDLGFLNSNEVNYAINAAIQSLSIPSKVSDLTNDAGYQTAQDVASAIGSLNIPTKTSDLNNDSDFQTGTEVGSAISTAIGALNIPTDTGDLTNSVEFQTLSEVTALINQAISGITSLHFEVVQTLPASGDSMTIYLVPKSSALLTNVFDEYIWYNNSWEKIGDTAVDLTNYIQKGSTFNNSRATATDASGNLVTTDTTATELGYLHGVTGDIQTQINGKAATSDVTAKQDIMQFDTMPTASAGNSGDIVQYTGGTSGGFTNGYFYKCVENSGTYSWVQTDVQPSQSGTASESEIAPVEATTTASRAYAVGDLLIYNGTLYRVTTAIASGGTIMTTGGSMNVAATTVSDVFVRKSGDTMTGELRTPALSVELHAKRNTDEGTTSFVSGEYNVIQQNINNGVAVGANNVLKVTDSSVSGYAADNAFVSGENNESGYRNQAVFGKFNNNRNIDIFEIGNGTDQNHKSNAMAVTSDGDLIMSGAISDGDGNVRVQYTTMPTPSATLEGNVVQYIGTTTAVYTNGYFYKCIPNPEVSGAFIWENVETQGGVNITVSTVDLVHGVSPLPTGSLYFFVED